MENNALNTQVVKEEKKQLPTTLVEKFLTQVTNYALISGEQLNEKTKTLVCNLVTSANKQIVSQGIKWNEVDIQGCGFFAQLKHWAKVGVTSEDKLYVDVRHNSKTNLKDIFIKPQYQTLEKLMIMYFHKNIVRFKTEVVCTGDVVTKQEDFETGLTKLVSHTRNEEIDRNNLDNIIGAYKIAYVEEYGRLVQYFVEIDKNRINRAYSASPSREKTVWKLDSQKMVKKTATWEMYNSELIRPFMIFPEDIVDDIKIVNESSEMDWNKETKHHSVEQAQEEAQTKVASEDVIDVTFDNND